MDKEKKKLTIPSWNDISESERPSSFKTKYELRESYFEDWESTLRSHQFDCILECIDPKIGQCFLPTATGKTWIQMWLHVEDMISKTKENKTGVYVIVAHRLTLCTQLLNTFYDLMCRCGLRFDPIYVGSEPYNFSKLQEKYRAFGSLNSGSEGEQTTNPDVIIKRVEAAQSNNKHAFIVSTYHSLDKLKNLKRIDVCTFDEAHKTVPSADFIENINTVKPIMDRQYFFTATKVVRGEDGGQNDEKFYGPTLYALPTVEALKMGEIVRPRIITIQVKNDKEIDLGIIMKVNTVIEAFENHQSQLRECSADRDKIGTKLLVSTNGLKELHLICSDEKFKEWCRINGIRTFVYSSDEGNNGYYIDFKKHNKIKTLGAMVALKDTENAILIHHDILTEGIDLPSITGVLLLRELTSTKLYQTVGRATRLLKEDRLKIYSNEIKFVYNPGKENEPYNPDLKEINKMIKPCCHVMLPYYVGTDFSKTGKLIEELQTSFGIPVSDIGEIEKRPPPPPPPPGRINDKSKSKDGKEYELEFYLEGRRIEQMKHDLEKNPHKFF